MVYNYLLDLYEILEQRKNELESGKALSVDSSESKEYLRGQINAVVEFTSFLKENYHEKLPRRMR
jgi:hypothetical protein